MTKIGIFARFGYPLPISERLQKIKQAGFEAVSLWWGDKEPDKNAQPELAQKYGLVVDNVHAPFDNANSLWDTASDGDSYIDMLIDCVRDCERHGIPTVVIHLTRFSTPPPLAEIGLERVRRLVRFAEDREINIAVENLSSPVHPDYIFQNISSERLGFCYDSGHENYRSGVDYLSRYGQKLFAVHLHDNTGDSDAHLIPYHGTTDWNGVMRRLASSRQLEYLSLEVNFKNTHPKSAAYSGLSADQYLSLCRDSALQLLAETN